MVDSGLWNEEERHKNADEQELEEGYPCVPRYRMELSEVDFAEGNEQYEEHEQRQDGSKERCHLCTCSIELGHKGEEQVGSSSDAHGYR